MSSATMREDAGFCPVMMCPALTANGDMSATARTYLAPFCVASEIASVSGPGTSPALYRPSKWSVGQYEMRLDQALLTEQCSVDSICCWLP